MLKLQAPYPKLQITTLLPSPQFGDSDAITDTVTVQEAMDGTVYSTVKATGRDKLRWDFILTRNKALELIEFYRRFASDDVKVTTHLDRVMVGKITVNPLEVRGEGRALPSLQGWSRGEKYSMSIEFEGSEI